MNPRHDEALIAFYRARLDEAEARATRGYYSDTHWEMWSSGVFLAGWQASRIHGSVDGDLSRVISDAAFAHARERVTKHEQVRSEAALQDIAAKRELLAEFEAGITAISVAEGTILQGGTKVRAGALRTAIAILASAHRRHPDYLPAFAPTP